eukprot:m.384470 g.384470  ORF g.384470 m.384470 type:complete len:60 (+) comp132495_c0_seq1:42-221(+)
MVLCTLEQSFHFLAEGFLSSVAMWAALATVVQITIASVSAAVWPIKLSLHRRAWSATTH